MSETITISKKNLWQGATILFAALFIASLFWNTASELVIEESVKEAPSVNPALVLEEPARVRISLTGAAAVKGNDNAPVTIVEYSDYQCPYCARFFSQTLPGLLRDYVEKGKVNLVYKDLPLPFHQNAKSAAIAARCAGDQDDYWGMHDLLFENNPVWSASANVEELFVSYADKLKMNTVKFKECLSSGKFDKLIEANIVEANNAGLSGTPSFLINGLSIVGAQPYTVFKQIIEEELN